MNDLSPRVREAIKTLLERFEEHEYNPTPIVDLGVMVAQADGKLDPGEAVALSRVARRLLGADVSVEIVELLFGASLEVLEMAGFDSRARLLSDILRDCDAVEPAFIVAVELALSVDRSPDSMRVMSAASGKAPALRLRDPERNVLERLATAAGFSHAALDRVIAAALAERAAATSVTSVASETKGDDAATKGDEAEAP